MGVCWAHIGRALGAHWVRIGRIGHALCAHCTRVVSIARAWYAWQLYAHTLPACRGFFFSPGTCEHKNNPIPCFSFFLFSLSWSFFIFYFCSFHILHFFFLVLFYFLFSSSFLPTTGRRTLLPALAKEAIPGNQLEGRWGALELLTGLKPNLDVRTNKGTRNRRLIASE